MTLENAFNARRLYVLADFPDDWSAKVFLSIPLVAFVSVSFSSVADCESTVEEIALGLTMGVADEIVTLEAITLSFLTTISLILVNLGMT